MRRSLQRLVTNVALCVLCASSPLLSQPEVPAERYFWTSLGIDGGDESFVDMHPGDDMLPYTDDDIVLPERGNSGGSWSSSHHDNNSNRKIDDASEHIFVIIKRQDDAFQSFSILSRPEYGVIYEAEDWQDYHDARNDGPSAACTADPRPQFEGGPCQEDDDPDTVPLGDEGNDFEHNDRPAWEGESNAFLYNNLMANQHGKGKPRYYFEHINPSVAGEVAPQEPWVYQEIQGWEKMLSFQHNLDDPTTGFNERGGCRSEYMRSLKAVTKGYLIPVADLPDLGDGSLPTLFAWEQVDLAAYLRDTILPLLEDENLHLWSSELDSTDYSLGLPPTHLMVLQVEVPMDVNAGGTCSAGQAQAQAMADYWGIPASGGTYRVCSLLGFNAELHAGVLGEFVHEWLDEPDDGAMRNLWLYDPLLGELPGDPSSLGSYKTSGGPWQLAQDPGFAIIDDTNNLVLTTSAPGSIRAALPKTLGANEIPLELVVDLAEGDLLGGGGGGAEAVYQIILEGEGGGVVAYAEVSAEGSTVNVGGELDAEGRASDPTSSASGDGGGIGDISVGDYTRYVLAVTGDSVVLRESLSNEYELNDFNGLNDFPELASLSAVAIGTGPSAVRITALGVTDGLDVGLSTLALFASPPLETGGPWQRAGDFNQDGNFDVSDPVSLLNHLFLGGPPPQCGDGTLTDPANLTLLDCNGDGRIDLSDAVCKLQFLFLGGPPPVACVDPRCEECIVITGCPDVCE